MKENKKFFLGVFVGLVVMMILTAGFVKLAFENRTVRVLVFDIVKRMSTVADEGVQRNDTTTGPAINWDEVSKK